MLLGRINIAEGDLKLAGTKYHLERGDITFIDPVRIDPVLDVEATTRVRDYDITIGLHGTLERLNTTYRSDPPLSSDDIISLLAFGKTQTENAMGELAVAWAGAGSVRSAAELGAESDADQSRVEAVWVELDSHQSVGRRRGKRSQRAADDRAAGVEQHHADRTLPTWRARRRR